MIDWSLIRSLEGFSLSGYVPALSTGAKSGVTCGTGCDFGQMNEADLARLALPPALTQRLEVYLGLKGMLAATELARFPLTLSLAEANAIDHAMAGPKLSRLRDQYNGVVLPIGYPGFDEIGTGPQTIGFSLDWQYGDVPSRCPRFWRFYCAQEWSAVIDTLRNFGDAYPTRREREATYLETWLQARAAQ